MPSPEWPVVLRCATPAALPGHERWLSRLERERGDAFADLRARRTWLLGRLLAKEVVREVAESRVPLAAIVVVSRDGLGRGVRPTAFVGGRPVQGSLSIAHADGCATVAFLPADRGVGVDVVPEESPAARHLRLWDGGAGSADPATLLRRWAMKEAAYKALNRGGPFRPAAVEVRADPGDGSRFEAESDGALGTGFVMSFERWTVAVAVSAGRSPGAARGGATEP